MNLWCLGICLMNVTEYISRTSYRYVTHTFGCETILRHWLWCRCWSFAASDTLAISHGPKLSRPSPTLCWWEHSDSIMHCINNQSTCRHTCIIFPHMYLPSSNRPWDCYLSHYQVLITQKSYRWTRRIDLYLSISSHVMCAKSDAYCRHPSSVTKMII